ncbi:hypothetical protein PMIN05_002807 [Paraphaeosphaeria minitans]
MWYFSFCRRPAHLIHIHEHLNRNKTHHVNSERTTAYNAAQVSLWIELTQVPTYLGTPYGAKRRHHRRPANTLLWHHISNARSLRTNPEDRRLAELCALSIADAAIQKRQGRAS